jgi:RecA/RadA recombinase
MSLADSFIKASKKMKGAGQFSKVLKEEREYYDTGILALNLAFSGNINKGVSDGVTCIAGKSKSFKTLFGLISCKAFLDANPEGTMIFYDSEGGASQEYFESVGIDTSRVIYIPIMNIEELKFDIMEKLEAIKDSYAETKQYEQFVFFVDSIGNLASIKEVKDSLSGNMAADMGTRAKSLKALFRIITPYFTNYRMHMIAIMHTYDEMASMGAPKQIMSGGNGPMYSSNNVFIIGKRQIKEGKEIIGWQFMLNIEKSRTIREKAIIPFEVVYNGGMDKYTGMLDIAIASGHVIKPKMGWYSRPSVVDDKSWRKKDTSCAEFWDTILSSESFNKSIKEMYCLGGGNTLMQDKIDSVLSDDEHLDEETGEITFTSNQD